MQYMGPPNKAEIMCQERSPYENAGKPFGVWASGALPRTLIVLEKLTALYRPPSW